MGLAGLLPLKISPHVILDLNGILLLLIAYLYQILRIVLTVEGTFHWSFLHSCLLSNSIRDDIKSSRKFDIRSSFKIGGREGVQWR